MTPYSNAKTKTTVYSSIYSIGKKHTYWANPPWKMKHAETWIMTRRTVLLHRKSSEQNNLKRRAVRAGTGYRPTRSNGWATECNNEQHNSHGGTRKNHGVDQPTAYCTLCNGFLPYSHAARAVDWMTSHMTQTLFSQRRHHQHVWVSYSWRFYPRDARGVCLIKILMAVEMCFCTTTVPFFIFSTCSWIYSPSFYIFFRMRWNVRHIEVEEHTRQLRYTVLYCVW